MLRCTDKPTKPDPKGLPVARVLVQNKTTVIIGSDGEHKVQLEGEPMHFLKCGQSSMIHLARNGQLLIGTSWDHVALYDVRARTLTRVSLTADWDLGHDQDFRPPAFLVNEIKGTVDCALQDHSTLKVFKMEPDDILNGNNVPDEFHLLPRWVQRLSGSMLNSMKMLMRTTAEFAV